MKAVILAGGLGTRISEESVMKPKPMIEIGNMPILWHIMKIYSYYGINDFIICLGYKGYMIKEYFANYFLHTSDITFDIQNNSMMVHSHHAEPWKVTLVDTGENTMTGGRLLRIKEYLNNEDFCMTYGDGVGNINLLALIEQHKREGRLATITACQPPGRFGALEIVDNYVDSFQEKPIGDGSWINAGFFVLSPKVLDYIDGDNTMWENKPIKKIVSDGQLTVYKHYGFWQPMDVLRDKNYLEDLWKKGEALWKIWK